MIFWSILASKFDHKTDDKYNPFWNPFWDLFYSILGSSWTLGPPPPRRPKVDHPQRKRGSSSLEGGFWRLFVHIASRSHFQSILDRSWVPFSSTLGQIWSQNTLKIGYKSRSTANFLFHRFRDQILKRIEVWMQLLQRIGTDFWVTFDSRDQTNEAKTFESYPFTAGKMKQKHLRVVHFGQRPFQMSASEKIKKT